jgi:hypothetical protein
MKIAYSLLMLAVMLLSGGCATITSSENQQVSLTIHTVDGQIVEKTKCTLKNDKGDWQADAPGFVSVRRSAEDLIVECKKDGQPDGFLRAISRAAGGMFGNIIFGGGIGAIIDHSKGTGYNYPDTLPIKMGKSVVVDRHDEQQAPGDRPQPSSNQQAVVETNQDKQGQQNAQQASGNPPLPSAKQQVLIEATKDTQGQQNQQQSSGDPPRQPSNEQAAVEPAQNKQGQESK